MRRDPSRAVFLAALLSLGGAACGGPETQTDMVIEMQSQALLEDASLLAIYFYGADQTCETVRAAMPRPPSVLGPFAANLDAASRQAGALLRQDAVAVGTYLVWVDAFDDNGGLVGTGCSPEQRVLEREVSSIKVLVRDP